MGSKSRIAKYIVPIIQDRLDENLTIYIEPFCGGGNVIDKIKCKNKIASDNNEYLIELFKNANKVKTELPDIVTKEHYKECKEACKYNDFSKYPMWYLAAIGFFASYSGKFYDGGFNGVGFLEERSKRHYYDEARRNFIKQIPNLKNIEFRYGDYEELYQEGMWFDCVFYCDIPYKNTTQYSTSIGFNYDRFWNWADRMSKNNTVLVSEYQAPNNWECIWSKPLPKTMNHGNNVQALERLFEIENSGEI